MDLGSINVESELADAGFALYFKWLGRRMLEQKNYIFPVKGLWVAG
jgi:hypothetical protein